MSALPDLTRYGIYHANYLRNPPAAKLYEESVLRDHGVISSAGALISRSGTKTGRSPKDKRIMQHPESSPDIWWGDVNIPLTEQSFIINRQRAVDFLNFSPNI